MTTVEITLPDELAQEARAAGLLAPEAIERILREQLRKRAGEDLRTMWTRPPDEEITEDRMQEIVEAVNAVRSARRKRAAT